MKTSLVYPKLGGQLSGAIGIIMGSFDPPLGIMYASSFLKNHGIDVNLIDLSFSKSWNEYREELLKYKPDIVGISSLSPFADQAFLAVSIAKKVLPKCKVIMGGAHPTALPIETINSSDVDFVVIGEGEQTLLELIRTLENNKDLSKIKGLVYKEGNKIYRTPPREFIQNLDEIPFPSRESLPTWKKYLSQVPFFPFIHPYTTIMGARGCPFNCSFCQPMLRKLFGKLLRLRSPQNVLEEIHLLVNRYKIKSLFFFDDTFTAIPQWAEEICDRFIQGNLNILWGINSRVNTFSYPLAQKLKKAGCVYASFGVESGSQKILDESLNKGIKIDQIIEAFDICKRVGLISAASLMIGSPGDTRETIQETISLIKKIKPDIIDVHFTTPTPGSNMYEKVKDTLLTSKKNRYRAGGLKLPDISDKELQKLYNQIQIEWRKTKGQNKHYKIMKKKYFFRNLFQGFKNPFKYLVCLVVLMAEDSIIIYKISRAFKKILSKIIVS